MKMDVRQAMSRKWSIDLSKETPITLSKASRIVPGGPVHVSTMHRWGLKGCRGVRLETFLRGGIRHTTPEALERFFAATTAVADGDVPPQAAIEQLAQFLLELSAAHPIAAECIRCGQVPSHHHEGLAYCELCRGCYEPEARTDIE